jgi:tetratricopeptide (TPR) repeat protein
VAQHDDLKLPLTAAAGEQADKPAQEPVQQTHQHRAQSEPARPPAPTCFIRVERISLRHRYSAYVRAQLARVVFEQGRVTEAVELLELAEQEGKGENIRFQLHRRTARAKVLATRGETVEAERLAREAVEIVGATDNINAHAEALVDLAEVLQISGDESAAAAALEAAIPLYEEKGNLLLCGASARNVRISWLKELELKHPDPGPRASLAFAGVRDRRVLACQLVDEVRVLGEDAALQGVALLSGHRCDIEPRGRAPGHGHPEATVPCPRARLRR